MSHAIKFCWWRHGQILWRHTLCFKILLRPRVPIFADITKIVTIFIKTILKDTTKVKKLEIIYQTAIYICISWYNKICWFLVKKCWCQQNSICMSHDSYIFWIIFRWDTNVPWLIIVGYAWKILESGAFLPLPIHEELWIDPSWIELKIHNFFSDNLYLCVHQYCRHWKTW